MKIYNNTNITYSAIEHNSRKNTKQNVPADLKTALEIDVKHPGRALRRVGKELKFATTQGDVLRPLYDMHRQRYVVYWDLMK